MFTAESIWIGLEKGSGQWKWNDGDPLNYTNWAPGEPKDDPNDLCGIMRRSDGKWIACDCNERLAFICQLYL